MEFLKACLHKNTVPLPKLITSVKDSSYSLSNYNMNQGVSDAVSHSINVGTEKIVTLNLSNNILKDDNMSHLLESLDPNTQIPFLKHLIYTNQNEFGNKTA